MPKCKIVRVLVGDDLAELVFLFGIGTEYAEHADKDKKSEVRMGG